MSIEVITEKLSVEYQELCAGVHVLRYDQPVDIVEIGQQAGLEPLPHNQAGDVVWDVRPLSNNRGVARSHTAAEFTFHTDASFESTPPRFFMLQTLHEDTLGGGVQHFIQLEDMISRLSPKDVSALETERIDWNIPIEFQRESSQVSLPILFRDIGNQPAIRFREECMRYVASDQIAMYGLLDAIQGAVTYTNIPRLHEILLVDNWHVLHAREAVKDPNRHLLRARFI